MPDKLPARARPAMLAKHRTRLGGRLGADELPRLSELCRSRVARVDATLAFALEEASGRLLMHVHVRAELHLTCQRCLAAMAWRADHRNRVFVVSDHETARSLPRGADHVVCTAHEIAPAEVIEEELLLLLPQIPTHESIEQCDPGMVAHLRDGRTRDAGDDRRRNPFAVLKSMRL